MRYLLIAIVVLALSAGVMAEQITLSLDRCVVLNNSNRQDADSKVAIHFVLPQELQGRDIVYAELLFSLPSMRLRADSLLLIRFYPLLTEWSESDINYDGSEAFTDSMTAAVNTVQLADSSSLNFDLTFYIKDIVDGQRSNLGLIAKANLLGSENIRLPDGLNNRIRNQARLKIVYR